VVKDPRKSFITLLVTNAMILAHVGTPHQLSAAQDSDITSLGPEPLMMPAAAPFPQTMPLAPQ